MINITLISNLSLFMQIGHVLQFYCLSCKTPVQFSIFDLENNNQITCKECQLCFDFNDPVLMRQLQKFVNLCKQIQMSEEILSKTSVGIYVAGREVKIPYKLLLTRLNSTLELMVEDQPLTITFRIEPSIDTPVLENYFKNHLE